MPGGRKLKRDFENDAELLVFVEGWARDGLEDKQIAEKLGYNESHFSTLKGKNPKLSNALKKGRAPLDFVVETSLYKRASGQAIQRTVTTVKKDILVDGVPTGAVEVLTTETVTTLPPDTGAGMAWLKQRKPELWNKQPSRIDVTSNGKEVEMFPAFDEFMDKCKDLADADREQNKKEA